MKERATVPVKKMVEAFERSGLTLTELTEAMGYDKHSTTTAARLMGKRKDKGKYTTHITPTSAKRFVEACGFDPVDFDF